MTDDEAYGTKADAIIGNIKPIRITLNDGTKVTNWINFPKQVIDILWYRFTEQLYDTDIPDILIITQTDTTLTFIYWTGIKFTLHTWQYDTTGGYYSIIHYYKEI
jgi:hypothetical protein